MKNQLKIIYLLNSGLILQSKKAKLMIDGLMEDHTIVDTMTPDRKEEQIEGKGIFSNIDAILFTHFHGDHFSADRIRGYLQKHPSVKMVLPAGKEAEPWSGMRQTMIMETSPFQSKQITIGDFEIEFFKTGHVSEELVGGGEHTVFLIRGCGRCIAVTADFNLKKINALEKKCREADTIFCNPLVLGTEETRAMLKRLHTARFFIYHIPIISEDRYGYRKIAVQNYRKYQRELEGCSLLLEHYIEVPYSQK